MFLLLKIEQGLCFNHCHLVGVGGEGVYVQLGPPGLEVNVAERLELADFQFREFDKHAAVAGETFEVGVALAVEVGTHFLDLKIGHVTNSPAQGAFVGPRAAELKTFEQSPRRQQLAGSAYDLGQADVAGKDTDDVRASRYPDNRFVLFSIQMAVGVYLEKLRMQGSLKKTKHQLINRHIDLR
jgi:hypothetical protein